METVVFSFFVYILIIENSLVYCQCQGSTHGQLDGLPEVVCRQVKKISCVGHFINRIATKYECRDSKGGHGMNCTKDEECAIPKSVCYAGCCLCTPGLYYSPTQNACLEKCTKYGTKMDIYKGGGILSHNDVTLDYLTVCECCEMCVKEGNFTCLTSDLYHKGGCTLSSFGYLDVPEVSRETGLSEWSLAQRQCK